jgi:uncharacterized protein (DUF3820 family)
MEFSDYDVNWKWPFGKYRGKAIADTPDSYLDWVIGEEWFFRQPRNKDLIEVIVKELQLRKRSGAEITEDRGTDR